MKIFVNLLFITLLYYWILFPSVSTKNEAIPNSTKKNSKQHVNEIAVEILTKCYSNIKDIVIDGSMNDLIVGSIYESLSFAVFLCDDSSKINNNPEARWKQNLFFMAPDSETQLQGMLTTFKNSPWWNIMGTYVILDNSNWKCKNAPNILKTAWKMNLINSIFLCTNSDDVTMIYTYNPFTNRAPKEWKLIHSLTQPSKGWTMYARPHNSENVCKGLNFDRTEHLDGFTLKVVTTIMKPYTWIPDEEYDENLLNKMWPFDRAMAKALKYSFNATLVYNADGPGYDTRKPPHGYLKRIQNKSSDIGLSLRTRPISYNFTLSYPVIYSNYHIATNNRGFYTLWEKIKNYYGIVTLISLCVILIMTYIVIIFMGKKRRWAFATFEVLRLLINTSIYSRMNKLSIKIFFSMIFLYFLIIHATLQGHISAFLTKDEYRPNAEKLEDLRDSRYTAIHVSSALATYIKDPVLREKMVVDWDKPDCSSRVIGNDSAACIADIVYLVIPAFKNHFHISTQPIRGNVYHYVSQDEDYWPLKKRFDTFLMWMEQSGIITKWYNDNIESTIASQKRITAMSKIHQRTISLDMLKFIFIFYGFGMILAIISFGFEVWIKPSPLKREQNKRQINVRFLQKQIIRKIIKDAKISVRRANATNRRGRC